MGGNLIDYPGDVSTRTADLTTAKLLWNSVLSKRKRSSSRGRKHNLARFMCMDVKNFYLNTPMERPEYMRFHISQIPDEIIDASSLLTAYPSEEADGKVWKAFAINAKAELERGNAQTSQIKKGLQDFKTTIGSASKVGIKTNPITK